MNSDDQRNDTVSPGDKQDQAQEQELAADSPDTITFDGNSTDAWSSEAQLSHGISPNRGRLFADYELVEEIARGGMGVVYKARQVSLNRTVALKMIRSGKLADDMEVERFRKEAEAAANLDHPGIVPVYEVGEHKGQHYFSMGYVEGRSLSTRLREGPLPATEAARMTRQLADAVAYAHGCGVIHRDLKPGNVLMAGDDAPRITDFGLSKRIEEDSELTCTGQILGTPSYMPPEQASGRKIGPAADVYALGAILYSLLTARPPFQAASIADTLRQVTEQEPVSPRWLNASVPRDLENITLKCLSKEATRRYATAGELSDDLRRFLAGEPTKARPVTRLERAGKWVKRRPAMAALVVASFIAVLALGGAGVGGVYNLQLETANQRLLAAFDREAFARSGAEQARKEAEDAQAAEEIQRKQKEAALEQAESNLYLLHIAQAEREWLADNVLRTEQLLDDCPQHLRNWEWNYLKRLCHSELFTIAGSNIEVHNTFLRPHGIAFHPDKSRLAQASDDNSIKLWDAQTGQQAATFPGHASGVLNLAFSSNGDRLVSASDDGTVIVWEVEKQQILQTMRIAGNDTFDVAFSPDGKQIATSALNLDQGEAAGELKIWNVQTGEAIYALTGHTKPVHSVAFSPDGQRLASASKDSTVRVWDVTSGEQLLILRGDRFPVNCVSYHPEGSQLASAGFDATIHLWDASSGEKIRSLPGHKNLVTSLAYSSDGKRLASASADQSVRVWDPSTGEQITVFRGHTRSVTGVAFSPDGQLLAAQDQWEEVKIWQTESAPGPREVHSGSFVYDMHLGQNSDVLAIAHGSHICVLDTSTRKPVPLGRPYRHSYENAAVLSPDATRLATVDKTGKIAIWHLATQQLQFSLQGIPTQILLQTVNWSLQGDRLAYVAPDQTVRICDADTGRAVVTIERQGRGVAEACWLAFDHDGGRLGVGESDRLMIHDTKDGRVLSSLPADHEIMTILFSPDGTRVAQTHASHNAIVVWDLANESVEFTLRGHTAIPLSLAFSSDGRRLFSAGMDRTIRIWDLRTGQEALVLRGHDNLVHLLRLDSREEVLCSADLANTVKRWDASVVVAESLAPSHMASKLVRRMPTAMPY